LKKSTAQNSIKTTKTTELSKTTEYNIGGKKYVVKSVFVGSKDIQTSLLNLAERKAIREMGMDMPICQGS